MIQVARFESHSFVSDLLGSSSTVVDLGMNKGAFAAQVIAAFGCRVVGLEPEPSLYASLQGRAGITVEPAAIAARDGTTELNVFATQCASIVGSVVEAAIRRVEVPATTFESFLRRHRITSIDLLKVDIEGAEFDLFDSTSDAVLQSIAQITVEFHDFIDPTQLPSVRRVHARLAALGFQRINFTHTNSDVMYVNRVVRQLTHLERAYIVSRFKYLTAARRIIGRWLGEEKSCS